MRLRAAWICPARLAHIFADRRVLVCGVRPPERIARRAPGAGEELPEASWKPPERSLDATALTSTDVNDKLGCGCVAGRVAGLDASWNSPGSPNTFFQITRRAFSCRISSESNSETGELTDPQLRRRIPKIAKMSIILGVFRSVGKILLDTSGSSPQYRIL